VTIPSFFFFVRFVAFVVKHWVAMGANTQSRCLFIVMMEQDDAGLNGYGSQAWKCGNCLRVWRVALW
jgi:hypothetical protein